MCMIQSDSGTYKRYSWETTKAVFLLAALMLFAAPVPCLSFSGSQISFNCLAPDPPFIPESDADFLDYVDVIAQGFEQYYANLTTYFSCVDAERQAVFQQAKDIGQLHQSFYSRAKKLGVSEQAAVSYEIEQ